MKPKSKRQSLIRLSLFIVAAFLLSGCMWDARTVRVNGYAEPQAKSDLLPGAMFTVQPDDTASNPILAKQIAFKLEMALNNSGWRVLSGQQAPLTLSFEFGENKSTGMRNRAVIVPGRPMIVTTRDRKGRVSVTEVDTPDQTRFVPEQVTVYDMWLKLRMNQTASGQAIWIGEAVYHSRTDDMRAVIDYMIAALVKIFGQDTKRQMRLTINKNDPVVQMLMPATP